MLKRRGIFTLIAVAALLCIGYRIRRQQLYQSFLNDVKIGFDDFPEDYVKVLNASVERGEQPTDFDYASTFTQNKIPHIIHFIWFRDLYHDTEGVTSIPSSGSHAPKLCREYNPTYEINIWNATAARNLLATEYPWFLPTYDAYRYPIQRVDAFKYFVLRHYGGVYMDLDIACRRALDPLLDIPAWFPEASPLGVNNDLMASAARHPVVERMTASLKAHNRNLIFPYLTIFYTTGPQFTSDILQASFEHNLVPRHPSRTHPEHDAVFVLPQIFYSEQYTFFGHSPGGTWHGSDVATILWLVKRPWVLLVILALVCGTAISTCRRRQYRLLK